MFTGIVSEMGTARNLSPTDGGRRITIEAPSTVEGLVIGDSVALNGVCLTAVELTDDTFTVEAVAETLDRTNLGALSTGDAVDLERPVEAAGGRFDGHVVQGHVDGVGVIRSTTDEGTAKRIRIAIPPTLERYVVEKGSVTVDGVSLTITGVSAVGDADPWFEIVLIPHTLDVTVLGRRGPGDRVNLETDILAKYVERLMEDGR